MYHVFPLPQPFTGRDNFLNSETGDKNCLQLPPLISRVALHCPYCASEALANMGKRLLLRFGSTLTSHESFAPLRTAFCSAFAGYHEFDDGD